MDLLQTVRKEGSRGGRADFKWEDVKGDAQRENYLGHSLMAPVGRWQQGRDLSWYAKGDEDSKESEAARLAEEKRKLKEAEEDAMLAAMGLPVPVRAENNANLTPLGKKAHEADVKETLEEKAKNEEDANRQSRKVKKERSRKHKDDDREHRRRHRSRSRSRDRQRDDRRRHHNRSRSREGRRDEDRHGRQRHRSRSRERQRGGECSQRSRERETRKYRSRSGSRSRRPRDDRSRSPYRKRDRRRD